MAYLQISMRLFMFLLMLLSIPMLFMSYSLNDKLDECPNNETAKTAARGLLIMSVSIFVMTFVFLMLSFICNCSNISTLDSGWVGVAMVIFSFLLGLTVLVLTIMINNSCKNVSNHTGGILGLAIAIMSLSIIYMVYRTYVIFYSGYRILHPTVYQTRGNQPAAKQAGIIPTSPGPSKVVQTRLPPPREIEMTDMATPREVVNVKVRENLQPIPRGRAQRPRGAWNPGARNRIVTGTSNVFQGVKSSF